MNSLIHFDRARKFFSPLHYDYYFLKNVLVEKKKQLDKHAKKKWQTKVTKDVIIRRLSFVFQRPSVVREAEVVPIKRRQFSVSRIQLRSVLVVFRTRVTQRRDHAVELFQTGFVKRQLRREIADLIDDFGIGGACLQRRRGFPFLIKCTEFDVTAGLGKRRFLRKEKKTKKHTTNK